jgi:integrase
MSALLQFSKVQYAVIQLSSNTDPPDRLILAYTDERTLRALIAGPSIVGLGFWEDIRFEDLTVMARRSIVDQVVGKVKTEASKRPIPIDPFIAEDMLAWYRTTKYSRPDDYVFATDAPRAGKKRGKQPVWLSKVMTYHIQPAAKRAGITKRIGWHMFRHTYTTLLHANGEDVKVVQELLRHGSAKITMDVYAQAVTTAKRKAQGKVVAMLRDTKTEEKSV